MKRSHYKMKIRTHLAMPSIRFVSESLKRADTVGVLGFMVTNRPLALVRVLFSEPRRTSRNISDSI